MTDFLPICKKDLKERGWQELDIILVTGDAYVDHPSYGTAVIGRVLEDSGFKVGVIAQPDWKRPDDFLKLGKPKLFFGVTAGNLDSILSNYTPNRAMRKKDDYSPGGKTGLRPNRASIVYSNRIKELFPDIPIVLGGIEASLRRLAHYDWWDDDVRRSILIDSKADMLVYGMGEKQVLEIAESLRKGEDIKELENIKGTVIIKKDISTLKNYIIIPSFEEVKLDKNKFTDAIKAVYFENNPYTGKAIVQKHSDRFIVQLPPREPLAVKELDRIYALNYEREWHPVYNKDGGVPGFETVRFSIISHRGCPGECNFCSLGLHQGRIIESRSVESILKEIEVLTNKKSFRGTIQDIGGPTANLYAASCLLWEQRIGGCKNKRCLSPQKCSNLKLGYDKTLKLWDMIMKMPKVKHLFIGSGIRYDLLVDKYSDKYLEALCRSHVSGQLKAAPEHTDEYVLDMMNKPSFSVYEKFVERFNRTNKAVNKKQYLVNYFISAHPGCDLEKAFKMSQYLARHNIHPEQIQDFIPLPMTISGSIYWTGKNPFTGKYVYSAKTIKDKKMQRALMQYSQPKNKGLVLEALEKLGKMHCKKVYYER